jgi:hypothetical protein
MVQEQKSILWNTTHPYTVAAVVEGDADVEYSESVFCRSTSDF